MEQMDIGDRNTKLEQKHAFSISFASRKYNEQRGWRIGWAQHGAGSIPAWYKYLYGLQVVVLGLAVYVIFLFVNSPKIQV